MSSLWIYFYESLSWKRTKECIHVSLTIGLRVIDRLLLRDVLVQFWLLLDITRSTVWRELLVFLNCTQALFNLLIVVTSRELVVCTTWFSFKVLHKNDNNRQNHIKNPVKNSLKMKPQVPESSSRSVSVKSYELSGLTHGLQTGWHQQLHSHVPDEAEKCYMPLHKLITNAHPKTSVADRIQFTLCKTTFLLSKAQFNIYDSGDKDSKPLSSQALPCIWFLRFRVN